MSRFVIKHVPSNRVYYEDEAGAWLADIEDGFFSFGKKEDADENFEWLKKSAKHDKGLVLTEFGDFPIEEFEVCEL